MFFAIRLLTREFAALWAPAARSAHARARDCHSHRDWLWSQLHSGATRHTCRPRGGVAVRVVLLRNPSSLRQAKAFLVTQTERNPESTPGYANSIGRCTVPTTPVFYPLP